ncbi:hypothetical protein [Nostoc sp. C110]
MGEAKRRKKSDPNWGKSEGFKKSDPNLGKSEAFNHPNKPKIT